MKGPCPSSSSEKGRETWFHAPLWLTPSHSIDLKQPNGNRLKMLHMTSFFQDLFLKVCDEILLGKEEIPQNSHMFALFDFPQMGYLMIPVVATPFLED